LRARDKIGGASILREAKQSIHVIAGLDPAIHLLRTIFLKWDGCAGHMREDALRALARA
jgi:hypothetical protein